MMVFKVEQNLVNNFGIFYEFRKDSEHIIGSFF